MSDSDHRRRAGAESPFSQLEAPADSSSGFTGEQRRRVFLDQDALGREVDVEKNLRTFGCDLSLIEFPEWQRTKHVHRLHPYLGKFIPQLVELFLRRFFAPGGIILDPFAGSGTTAVEANALGIGCVAIELSAFNCLIAEVKTGRYDLARLGREVGDALGRVEVFSQELVGEGRLRFHPCFRADSGYLNRWFAPRALQELLFYRSILHEYEHESVLKVILSRAARSCRLVPHYDLARPKEPLEPGTTYWCVKHRRECEPITEALKFLRRYSRDTVRRLEEFDRLRADAPVTILQGDARCEPLPAGLRLDGIFTSPPYVGLIDYHEQHRYAYELFPELERRDAQEIGPTAVGKGKKAREAYSADVVAALRRLLPHLKPDARVFVVANDRYDLYPDIGERAGLRLVDVFHRPVPMRTERDTRTYFESIFQFEPMDPGA
ncbi:MAG: DNA methyltransferase [Candidatus Brocadiia bacterium]